MGRQQDEEFGTGGSQFCQCGPDVLHRRTEVLPPVGGHQQLRSVRGYVVGNLGVGWCDLHRHGEVERVDDGVAGDGDIGRVDPFGEQVVP